MYSFDDPENPEEKRLERKSLRTISNSVETALWEVFDIDHDKKITREDAYRMHQLLRSIHTTLIRLRRVCLVCDFQRWTNFDFGSFCAYKHISNAIAYSGRSAN